MISFLRTHNLISQDQFGFLSRRSACTQLLITLNNWTLNVDNGMKVDVVYTDIAKAFDTVSHSKLLLKVEAYGFKSNLLQWIRAFLNDRTQCVYVGLDVSSPNPSPVVYLRVLSLALSCFCYMSMTFLTMSNLQLALKSLPMTQNCILVILKIKIHHLCNP